LKKIYLTVEIDAHDEVFKEMTHLEKLNFGDLATQIEINLDSSSLVIERVRLVAEYILKSKGDLLIGYAIQSKATLKQLLRKIEPDGFSISGIYFDNGKRRNGNLEKYKNTFALHFNWLDYSPEAIEHFHKEFENELLEIKVEAKLNKIEMISI